jgi:hypothetical protein
MAKRGEKKVTAATTGGSKGEAGKRSRPRPGAASGGDQPGESSTAISSSPRDEPRPSQDAIARRAYELHLSRGAGPGREAEDWFQAEEELITAWKHRTGGDSSG